MKPTSSITLGEPLRRLRCSAFTVTEASYNPTQYLARHAHDRLTISFVVKGYCLETVGRRVYECRPFSPIIKPEGLIHSNQYGRTGAKCILIEPMPLGLQLIRAVSALNQEVIHVTNRELRGLAVRIHRELQMMDASSEVSIEGLILEMIGAAHRQMTPVKSQRSPSWLRTAKDCIDSTFKERVSLFNIAIAVGVSPAYLSRMFRVHYGCTVGDYLRERRLDYATERLAHSSDPLVEIATAAGFYDQSHFSRAFKLRMALTPVEFRNALKSHQSDTKHSESS